MKQTVLNHAKSYVGTKEGTKKYTDFIDTYNAVKPIPVGYRVKYTDNWCAAFVTHIADISNASAYVGRECGVQRFISIFKQKGSWLGKATPQPGDIVVFDWQVNGWADHIGFVESVTPTHLTTIEGNTSKSVGRRTYTLKDARIVGYARPKYPSTQSPQQNIKKTNADIAREVIAGSWGNGAERSNKLKQAGYDPKVIQGEVNRQLNPKGNSLKANDVIAREVIQGKWSIGQFRKQRLIDAGYDYLQIQKLVNQLI